MNAVDKSDYLEAYTLIRDIIRIENTNRAAQETENLKEIISKIQNEIRDIAPQLGTAFEDFEAETVRFEDYLRYRPLIGKNVVVLGGEFSSGKSSFLNTIMEKEFQIQNGTNATMLPFLPEDVKETTSIPTFVLHKESGNSLTGINCFDSNFCVENLRNIRSISHVGISNGESGVELSHVIRTMFFSTNLMKYDRIAFLDTPGFRGEISENSRKLTDRQIATQELNSADFILWFCSCLDGTIRDEDICFLKELNPDTPKLIVVSKADLKTPKEAQDIKDEVVKSLRMRGVAVKDVLLFSKEESRSETEKLETYLQEWNTEKARPQFAHNFKRLFVDADRWCAEEIDALDEQIGLFEKIRTIIEVESVVAEAGRVSDKLIKRKKALIKKRNNLDDSKQNFFRELKRIGDSVGIDLPEPSELEILDGESADPLETLKRCLAKSGRKSIDEFQRVLEDNLSGVEAKINRDEGGIAYRETLRQVLNNLTLESEWN